MENIETINWVFQNGETPLDEEHLNELLTKLNILINAHNNRVQVETDAHALLSVKDANGKTLLRFNNNLEVTENGDLYVGGTKINA